MQPTLTPADNTNNVRWMLLVATATAIAVAGAAAVTLPSWCLSQPHTPRSDPEPKLHYVLRPTQGDVDILDSHGRAVCKFLRASLGVVAHNLYRLYARLEFGSRGQQMALFYRNTVGNGGFIEFWNLKPVQNSLILRGILTRFQPQKDDPVPPLRIYVSSKIKDGARELVLDDSLVRYSWTGGHIYRVDGESRVLAAKLQRNDSGESALYIHRDRINPYLAVCAYLFIGDGRRVSS